MKKCTNFEEQKGTRYIQGNVYFGIIVLSFLLSAKPLLRFFLLCITQKIKGFYQSSLGNEVDFRDIRTVLQISLLKIKISKSWDSFVDERALITTALIFSCYWKTYYLYPYKRKDLMLTLIVTCRKIVQKNKLSHPKQQ